MKHTDVTTLAVGGQEGCAPSGASGFAGFGAIEHQPYFPPVTRRDLMAAVNTASRKLGLRPSTVVVLDALLSCLPCTDAKTGADRPITPLTLLTVFACNDTLCYRAKGITDRQLRRHLETLEAAGLLRRCDSANGKRFPIMRHGKIVGAFGLDLSPLLARSAGILTLAEAERQRAEELRGLKACILKLRAECLLLDLSDEMLAFVEATRNSVRRATMCLQEANGILSKLHALLQDHRPTAAALATANQAAQDRAPLCEADDMTGSDGQNVRHKETPKSDTQTTPALSIKGLWSELTEIPAFYPDHPTSESALMRLFHDFGRMLRIDGALLAKAVSILGLSGAIRVADQMAAKAEAVKNPDGYLSKILMRGRSMLVGHGQLALRA